MSGVSTIKMTARQFLELGEDPPGVRLELVDGEIAVSPSPTPNHSYAVANLIWILIEHTKSRGLGQVFGDVDTIFGEHDVRRPDILFFSKQRLHLVGKKAMEGPPDLCVEVISPSSVTIDRQRKFRQYAAGGVAYYWIIDPQEQTIECFRLNGQEYVLASQGQGADTVRLPPFIDLDMRLKELWRPA